MESDERIEPVEIIRLVMEVLLSFANNFKKLSF